METLIDEIKLIVTKIIEFENRASSLLMTTFRKLELWCSEHNQWNLTQAASQKQKRIQWDHRRRNGSCSYRGRWVWKSRRPIIQNISNFRKFGFSVFWCEDYREKFFNWLLLLKFQTLDGGFDEGVSSYGCGKTWVWYRAKSLLIGFSGTYGLSRIQFKKQKQ